MPRVKKSTIARRKYINRWKLNRFKRLRSWVYSRCHYPTSQSWHTYGGRGIECRITWIEIARIWFRDVAWMMKDPHLDRIDPAGHYEWVNCRFIESVDNYARIIRKCKEAEEIERQPGEDDE